MSEAVHDAERLKELQALPLERKILITQTRIMEWYKHYKGNVYISFSGGKDSTVLLHLARQIYPDIPAVFSNTGLEYAEIQRFVKTWDNVDIVVPKMRFDEVISTYGYPLIGKEVAEAIYYARRLRSQSVQVERERESKAESAASCTENAQRETNGSKDSQIQAISHGMKQADWKRLGIVGGKHQHQPRAYREIMRGEYGRAGVVGNPTDQAKETDGLSLDSETPPG